MSGAGKSWNHRAFFYWIYRVSDASARAKWLHSVIHKPSINEMVGGVKNMREVLWKLPTLAVRNFISILSIFLVALRQSISLVPSPFSCIFEFKFICNWIIITFDDVCCNIRNVKSIKSCAVQANVCNRCRVLFLLKLKWLKSKNF